MRVCSQAFMIGMWKSEDYVLVTSWVRSVLPDHFYASEFANIGLSFSPHFIRHVNMPNAPMVLVGISHS